MKIKILKSTVAGGKTHKAGSTADVPDKDGRFLIAMGKAEAKGKRGGKEVLADKALSTKDLETR